MPAFRYQALNSQQQLVSGEVDAESVAQALVQLEASGLVVQSIGYAQLESSSITGSAEQGSGASPFGAADTPTGETIAQAMLQGHLGRILEQGGAISAALRAYAQEISSGRRRRELLAVARVLDQRDVQQAVVTLKGLPTYWIPLLSAATTSSDPGRVLREFLKESQRADELRRQWWLALAYPVLLACFAVAVMTALSFLVIPIFREIFQGFGLKLPFLTQFVLNLAAWITDGRLALAIVLAFVIGWALLQAVRLLPPALRQWLSDRSPFVIGRWTARARFAQFTADLLEAQLDIPGAIRVAAFASGNNRLARSAANLAGTIEAGDALPKSKLRPYFTAAIVHALRAEISAPARIRLLSELSRCYGERAQRSLSWTRGVIEPLAICLIGLVVGGTVIALFLPLISLIQGLAA